MTLRLSYLDQLRRCARPRVRLPGAGRMIHAALSGAILMTVLWSFAVHIYANGGAVEIFRGRQGLYEVVVAILPERPVVGTVHFSITPLDATTSLPVKDARIIVVANDETGEPTYQARAVNTPDAPQYYDANITFESPGAWTLLVAVRSEQLGEALVKVPLNVEEQQITPGSSGTWVFLGILVVLLGGATYIWYSGRRQRRATGG